MTTTAQKLQTRYNTARNLNEKLASEIGVGNGATGLTAVFFANASKDLSRVTMQVRQAMQNGVITVAEYKQILGI